MNIQIVENMSEINKIYNLEILEIYEINYLFSLYNILHLKSEKMIFLKISLALGHKGLQYASGILNTLHVSVCAVESDNWQFVRTSRKHDQHIS